MNEFRARAEMDLSRGAYAIRMAFRDQQPGLMVAKPVEFERVQAGAYLPPALVLEPDAAQVLMDELWRAGIRPSEIGTAGHLSATQAHLQDMRAIAFHKLGINK